MTTASELLWITLPTFVLVPLSVAGIANLSLSCSSNEY